MLVKLQSAALNGIEGNIIRVEIDASKGTKPSTVNANKDNDIFYFFISILYEFHFLLSSVVKKIILNCATQDNLFIEYFITISKIYIL